jgi:hypothetical protein
MKKWLAALLASAAFVAPAYASDGAPVSDILTVFNPAGAVDTQLTLFEDGVFSCVAGTFTCGSIANVGLGTEDPNGLYYITAPVDPTQLGAPVNVAEAGGTFSDIFGVASISQEVLGFTSDTETAPPAFAPVGSIVESEQNGPLSATIYLAPDLRIAGWTATFQSDPEIPEPATLTLVASGAALLGFARRRVRR